MALRVAHVVADRDGAAAGGIVDQNTVVAVARGVDVVEIDHRTGGQVEAVQSVGIRLRIIDQDLPVGGDLNAVDAVAAEDIIEIGQVGAHDHVDPAAGVIDLQTIAQVVVCAGVGQFDGRAGADQQARAAVAQEVVGVVPTAPGRAVHCDGARTQAVTQQFVVLAGIQHGAVAAVIGSVHSLERDGFVGIQLQPVAAVVLEHAVIDDDRAAASGGVDLHTGDVEVGFVVVGAVVERQAVIAVRAAAAFQRFDQDVVLPIRAECVVDLRVGCSPIQVVVGGQ